MDYTGKLFYSKSELHLKFFYDAFLCVCIIISLSIAIFNAMFFPAEVIGSSMYPTINSQYEVNGRHSDIVYATTWISPTRSDIILVNLPNFENDGIKRLIAVGGDTVCFGDVFNDTEGDIILNGKKLIEIYVKSSNISCVNGFKQQIRECLKDGNLIEQKIDGVTIRLNESNQYEMLLDKDYCIFLGDNREGSLDCSELGPQKMQGIHAKVCIIVPYGYSLLTYFSSKIFGAI